MSAFPNWQTYAVPQRRPGSGCIPTGYEILLRAAKITDIDYDTFQDDFDLDKDRGPDDPPQNNFVSVANAIKLRYPTVQFQRVVFPPGHGVDKLRFIEEHIAVQQPVLISLSLLPFGQRGWHIMPVVDSTQNEFTLLEHMDADGRKFLMNLSKSQLVRIHDDYEGGDDVAYLDY